MLKIQDRLNFYFLKLRYEDPFSAEEIKGIYRRVKNPTKRWFEALICVIREVACEGGTKLVVSVDFIRRLGSPISAELKSLGYFLETDGENVIISWGK